MVAYDNDHQDMDELFFNMDIPPPQPPATSSSSSSGMYATSSSSSSSYEKQHLQNEIDVLRRENDSLKFSETAEKNRLLAQCESLQDEVLNLKEDCKAKVRSIEVDREALKVKVRDVEVERDVLTGRVRDVEVEREMLREKVRESEAKVLVVQAEREEREKQLHNELVDAKKQYLDTQYALKQWREHREKMEHWEKTLMGVVAAEEDNYDAETEVLVHEVSRKRKRSDDDDTASESSHVSKKARSSNDVVVSMMNKMAHQSIMGHDASKPFHAKIQSFYDEFTHDEKYLRKVRAIFVKNEEKPDSAVRGQAATMREFVEDMMTV